jgi:nitroreductase
VHQATRHLEPLPSRQVEGPPADDGHAAVSDQEQARRVLGFPDGYFCAYLIGLGYPADRRLRPLVRPDRRPFDEVVHWDRW